MSNTPQYDRHSLAQKIKTMSEGELWSRRDYLDCSLDRYGYKESYSHELKLIEHEIATRIDEPVMYGQ